MSPDSQRRLALDILIQVAAGRPLSPLLDRALAALPAGSSRGFLVELVKGTLTWQGRYDHLIRRFSRRQFPTDPRVVNLLRLSCHQLLAMDAVPAYAAVHQAGELCRAVAAERFLPYVNGVLQNLARRLAAHPGEPERAILPLFPPPETDPLGFLSTYHSHPRWLMARWLQRHGLEASTVLCRHDNRPPTTTLHVLAPAEPAVIRRRLQASGLQVETGTRHPRALILRQRLERQDLKQLLARHTDLIVQDEGAQEVSAWLAEDGGGRLLDLCAAPGGKIFHLRGIWPATGCMVAMDCRQDRLALLVQTAKRIEARDLNVLLADGLVPPLRAGSFAAVLLDGPCSGTGVMRHHPEGRWRLQPTALPRYHDRLLALARQAVKLLAPGGKLLYSTCSIEPEENEEVIADILAENPALVPFPDERDYQRTWFPPETGTDGFFAARLLRKGMTS